MIVSDYYRLMLYYVTCNYILHLMFLKYNFILSILRLRNAKQEKDCYKKELM